VKIWAPLRTFVGLDVGVAEGAVGFDEGFAVKVGLVESLTVGFEDGRIVGAFVGFMDGTGPDNNDPRDDFR